MIEIEEAIEFVESKRIARLEGINQYDRVWNQKIDGIVDLLKNGDKNKKIVEEMDQVLEPGMVFEIPEGIDVVKYLFNQIKEKYFPEPVKKYITIEVEAGSENLVDAGMENIKELVDSIECPKMKIANEWKEK